MLGSSVAVYLDGGVAGSDYEPIGDRPGDTSSTIVDATKFATNGGRIVILRGGVISREAIAGVIGDALAPIGFVAEEPELEPEPEPEPEPVEPRPADTATDADRP